MHCIGVTLHCIDAEWQLRSCVLGCKEDIESQTTARIIDQLKSILRRYFDLDTMTAGGDQPPQRVIVAAVTDNGTNYTAARESLVKQQLCQMHLACACHTLQLAVNSIWSNQTLVGIRTKLRNMCDCIKRSKKLWTEIQRRRPSATRPRGDVETRWNSTLTMMESFVGLCESLTNLNFTLLATIAIQESQAEARRRAAKHNKFVRQKRQEKRLLEVQQKADQHLTRNRGKRKGIVNMQVPKLVRASDFANESPSPSASSTMKRNRSSNSANASGLAAVVAGSAATGATATTTTAATTSTTTTSEAISSSMANTDSIPPSSASAGTVHSGTSRTADDDPSAAAARSNVGDVSDITVAGSADDADAGDANEECAPDNLASAHDCQLTITDNIRRFVQNFPTPEEWRLIKALVALLKDAESLTNWAEQETVPTVARTYELLYIFIEALSQSDASSGVEEALIKEARERILAQLNERFFSRPVPRIVSLCWVFDPYRAVAVFHKGFPCYSSGRESADAAVQDAIKFAMQMDETWAKLQASFRDLSGSTSGNSGPSSNLAAEDSNLAGGSAAASTSVSEPGIGDNARLQPPIPPSANIVAPKPVDTDSSTFAVGTPVTGGILKTGIHRFVPRQVAPAVSPSRIRPETKLEQVCIIC